MFTRKFRRFLRDTSGAVFVQVALVAMALSGMAGLAIDVGYWYATQRAMQSAADAAAMAGAYEALWVGNSDAIIAAAKTDAARNGFDPATVTVDPGYASPDQVEVFIRQASPGMFSSLIMAGDDSLDIAVRSVAGRVDGVPICVLALDSSGGKALHLQSNTSITANGCMAQVNSSSNHAIETSSNAVLSAAAIGVVGDVNTTAGLSPSPETGVRAAEDPLAHLEPPDMSLDGCDHEPTRVVGGGTETLTQGVYCGGIEISGGADVTFEPGIYVIRDGKLKSSGSSFIHGDEVGFYLMGNGAAVDISGSTQVDFSAPTDGDMAGLVFYQGPDATASKSEFHGSDLKIEGTMYFPDQQLDISGGSTTLTMPPYTMIIADSLHMHDASTISIDSDYAGSAVPLPLTLGRYSIAILE